jgi:glutamate 5-kinase
MKATASRSAARRAKRVVVKVGSSILTDAGVLRRRVFADLTRQISTLQDEGREVVLVTSGAIAIGSRVLGWTHPGRSIPEKQAAAAVGQIGLVELYRKLFAKRGKQVAQILLTRTGLEDRDRFLNARRTFATLLDLGVVPIVNENDTVATEEIRFGDNDNLSANIVNLVGADLLVLLTDVEGLYAEPPRAGEAKPPLHDVVEVLTPEIERAAQGSSHAFGRGGMTTKIEAAKAAARSGAATIVCSGTVKDALLRACAGERVGTLFLPGARMSSRKHWLAFTTKPRGAITVDDGAARALLERGRSLLPAGVLSVQGRFAMGDPVSCVDLRGRELARGIAGYGSDEVERIKGRPTREIASLLGFSNGDEVIHRDDLVVVPEPATLKT